MFVVLWELVDSVIDKIEHFDRILASFDGLYFTISLNYMYCYCHSSIENIDHHYIMGFGSL